MRRLLCILAILILCTAPFLWAATITRVPTGIGALDGWTSSVPGDKFADVDDPVGTPDDADYIYVQADATSQQFTYAAVAVPAGATGIGVEVNYRAQRTAAGPINVAAKLRVGTSNYTGTQRAVTTSWAPYSGSSSWATTNPKTLAAWTIDDVNGAGANALSEIGVISTGYNAGEEARVSQIYLIISYNIGGVQRKLTTLGVGERR